MISKNAFQFSLGTGICLYFSFPVLIITSELLWGPLAATINLPAWFVRVFWIFLLFVPIGIFLLTRRIMKSPSISCFISRIILWGSFIVILLITLGETVHRDFFTAVFQQILIFPALFFMTMGLGAPWKTDRTTLKIFQKMALIIAFFYTQWIFMMGYAIATRAEPRPMESIAYNAYNLGLVFILLFSSRKIHLLGLRQLRCGPKTMHFDNRDMTAIMGEKMVTLLYSFIESPEMRLTCAEINKGQPICSSEESKNCEPNTKKASSCLRYRNSYNQVLELKKF